MTRIERIEEMEQCLEASQKAVAAMQEALEDYEAVQPAFKKLCDYYGSVRWMNDFEADEAGKLPKELKRGVLSEDAVYDLIVEHHEMTSRLLNIIAKNVEGHRA